MAGETRGGGGRPGRGAGGPGALEARRGGRPAVTAPTLSAGPRDPAAPRHAPGRGRRGGVRVSPRARWRGRGRGWGSGAGGLARAWRGDPSPGKQPHPGILIKRTLRVRDRAPQRDTPSPAQGLGTPFCAVIFLFCNWQCEASPRSSQGCAPGSEGRPLLPQDGEAQESLGEGTTRM